MDELENVDFAELCSTQEQLLMLNAYLLECSGRLFLHWLNLMLMFR